MHWASRVKIFNSPLLDEVGSGSCFIGREARNIISKICLLLLMLLMKHQMKLISVQISLTYLSKYVCIDYEKENLFTCTSDLKSTGKIIFCKSNQLQVLLSFININGHISDSNMEKEDQTVIYSPGSQYVRRANVVIAPIKRVIVSSNVPAEIGF